MSDRNTNTLFSELRQTIAALRHPETGCPWDLKQTHATLRKYMIEEAYEAAAEMESERASMELCDELGDVLLQVVLNAQLAEDDGCFTIDDVITSINNKMVRRHPHVFKPDENSRDISEIKKNWDQIKAEEKPQKSNASYFSPADKVQPALSRAAKIGKLAAKIKFDWQNISEVMSQLESEVAELKEVIERGEFENHRQELEDELGDVLFSTAQLARHLNLDPESAAHHGNNKFCKRFRKLEDYAKQQSISVENASRDQLEKLWQEAKTNSP